MPPPAARRVVDRSGPARRGAASPAAAPHASGPRTVGGRRPGPAPAHGKTADPAATRDLIFSAAAEAFSAHGHDGASVDDIARRARVNKAMLYYHFDSKLGLYREVVRDMLRAVGERVAAIAASDESAPHKLEHFIEMMCDMRDLRPWFPPLMLREMADGAPRLDPDTLGLLRTVFGGFGAILQQGEAAGDFRPVHPVLAYISILGPLLMNAVRERVGAAPGRRNLPIFAPVDRLALVAHMQQTALRMLARGNAAKKDRTR